MADYEVTEPEKGDDTTGQEEDGRILLSERSESEIVKQVLDWWKESSDASKEWRKLRQTCHKMFDGEQWEETDLKRMKDQKRPALTFNLLISIIAAVTGQEQNNRQEMRYFGVGDEDDQSASSWSKILKWVVDQNDGEFAMSDQFDEMLKSGEGWIVPDIDFLEDPEGRLTLEFVDNDEMFDDPLSTDPTGLDARYRQRVKMLTADEGEARWPGKFDAALKKCALENSIDISETDGKGFPDIYLTPDKPTKSVKRHDAKEKTWAVIQSWWWQIEDGYHVLNEQSGQIEEVTPEEFEQRKAARQEEQHAALSQLLAGAGNPAGVIGGELPGLTMPQVEIPPALKAQKRPIKRVYEAFVVYDTVLESGPLDVDLKIFPAVPLRGIRRKSKNDWMGLLLPLIDPQRQHNVEQSAILQLVQLMPKNSWMAPRGAYHNKHEWETGVAQPGKMLEYNDRRGKPEQIQPPAVPRHMIDMAFSRPQSMREISGVNVELTGVRQGSDAGVVMEQRAKAAQTVLAPLFQNARRSRRVLGRVMLAYMKRYLSEGRRIRVVGDDPNDIEAVSVSNDMLAGKFDLKVDETESTLNDRISTLNIMQTVLPKIMQAGIPVPPEFVDLLPMDPKIRKSWKRMIAYQLELQGMMPPPGWEPGMPVQPPMPPSGEEPPL